MIDVLTQTIMALDKHEQDQMFKVLSENANIIIKLIPDAPLLKYIVTGHTNSTDPIIQAYVAWKSIN